MRVTGLFRLGVCAVVAATACSAVIAQTTFAPRFVPPYPYVDPALATASADKLSTSLEQHIKQWSAGAASASLPATVTPAGSAAMLSSYRLIDERAIDPKAQWAYRYTEKVSPDGSNHALYEDPHATYLVLPYLYAPFGAKVIIEGEFPYCRFFDIQVSPTFDPRAYYGDRIFGVGEVPFVDADIDPLPGNVNPFRIGANRYAGNRKYRVEFSLDKGNAAQRNRAFVGPYYRDSAQVRYASGIEFAGPGITGATQSAVSDPSTLLTTGAIWIRYYDIDGGKGRSGGVPPPRVTYALRDGTRFFISADFSKYQQRADQTFAVQPTEPEEPRAPYGPQDGWNKSFGIFLELLTGATRSVTRDRAGPALKALVRREDLGATSRSADLPAPNSAEPSATSATYTHYLTRTMSLGAGKVAVLTGQLPTFPLTSSSEANMPPAQMRYWSLTAYESPNRIEANVANSAGVVLWSIKDSDLVLNAVRRFTIVVSRPEDRPRNATAAAGVTWVNAGHYSKQSYTLRWIAVHPEWDDDALSPNEVRLPWATTSWSSPRYDPHLIGENNHAGALGWYLPQSGYLTRTDFERLGATVDPAAVPARWDVTALAPGRRSRSVR